MQAYAQRGKLSAELNSLQTVIEDSKYQLKILRKYHKLKGIHGELKNLSGRKEKKFKEQNAYELQEYKEVSRQLLEWYPDKHLPTIDDLEQKITALSHQNTPPAPLRFHQDDSVFSLDCTDILLSHHILYIFS